MKRGDGFTLIETLIALSLAVFLMLVVWRMFDVYTKIEDKGVRASQQAAVVRAVQRQLRSDLMRLVYIDPGRPSPTQIVDTDQTVYPTNGYFFGTSTELSFVTGGGHAHEIQRVVSYMPQRTKTRSQQGFLAGNDLGNESPTGVIRVDQSWIAFQSARVLAVDDFSRFNAGRKIDLQKDDFLIIGQSQTNPKEQRPISTKPEIRDPIPEIGNWKFRYFDRGWRDRWDSSWHRRLPAAIEISFDMAESKPQKRPRGNEVVSSTKEGPVQHRFVISLGINSSITTRDMP